jgi:hypothetical protein
VLGTALTLNIAWPRGEGIAWYNKWSGFLYVGVAIVLALGYYVLGGRKAREAIERPLAGSGAASRGSAAAEAPAPALHGAAATTEAPAG